MKYICSIWLLIFSSNIFLESSAKLPDWMVSNFTQATSITKTGYGTVMITNGLISREFTYFPDFATVDFHSYEKDMSLLRAVGPEAIIGMGGIVYNIGGLITNTPRGYLNRTDLVQKCTLDPQAFHFVNYSIKSPVAPYKYRPLRGAPDNIVWPPKGLRLDVDFRAPSWAPYYHQMVKVTVHYEMYDGIPLIVKWISVTAQHEASKRVEVQVYSVEYLAVNQQWAPVGYNGNNGNPPLYQLPTGYGWMFVETNEPHGTEVTWGNDPSMGSMPGSFQPVVNCTYQMTPAIPISEGFVSFHVHELVIGTLDPTRHALARHRMFRMLAPQAQENPVFFHMVNPLSVTIRELVDQMAEVGFELLIYSFGSGFNVESTDEKYIQNIAADIAYARSKGIEVGGYDLIALSRHVKFDWMALAPGKNQSIGSACFASGWYDFLTERVISFIEKTGIRNLETDGPYGGYQCGSTKHAHHRGLEDSVYVQNKLQGDFYRMLREKEIYINQPDAYFYQGGSKTGMGYNENQYSLPRWQDLSVSRQGMYDDLYLRIPTAGWMFVPLVQYHGGGAPAVFEPLKDHLLEYEWALAQYMGAGVAACYRGTRLYDSDQTKAVVMKWTSFYKKYRQILISDVVHVRRADMQYIDSFMHVNPFLQDKGLAMVFNPTHEHIVTKLTLPLYYTGLTDRAYIGEQAMNSKFYTLDRNYDVEVNVDMKPLTITWFLIQ